MFRRKGNRRAGEYAWGLVLAEGEERLVRASRGKDGIVLSPSSEKWSVEAFSSDRSDNARRSQPGVTALLSDLSLHHETVSFPSMKPQQMMKAIDHWLTSRPPEDGGVEVSFSRGPDASNGDVLVVTVGKEGARKAVRKIADRGYRVDGLSTAVTALVALISEMCLEIGVDEVTVIVHLGEEIGTIGFVRGDRLLLAREFRIPEAAAVVAEEDETESSSPYGAAWKELVATEIARSLLFFNHQFKGKQVDRVLLSSDTDSAWEILPVCVEQLKTKVELIVDAIGFDVSGFGEGERAKRTAGKWVSAIAAAVAGLNEKPDINLLPTEALAERSWKRVSLLSTTVFSCLIVAMFTFHIYHVFQAYSLESDIGRYESRILTAKRDVALLGDVREERLTAMERFEFTEHGKQPIRFFAEALRVLSIASTDGLVVESVILGNDGNGRPDFVKTFGSVSGTDAADVQSQFNRFFRALRESPVFHGAQVAPLRILGSNVERGAVLSFEIQASVEEI